MVSCTWATRLGAKHFLLQFEHLPGLYFGIKIPAEFGERISKVAACHQRIRVFGAKHFLLTIEQFTGLGDGLGIFAFLVKRTG